MQSQSAKKNARLPPEVNRILFVKGLPYDITSDEIYDLFGKYGPIRQVRLCVLSLFLNCYLSHNLEEIVRTRKVQDLLYMMIFMMQKMLENI